MIYPPGPAYGQRPYDQPAATYRGPGPVEPTRPPGA